MFRLTAALSLSIAAVFGQTVEGTATNSLTSAPVGDVKVSIESAGKSVRDVFTDPQGAFHIEGLAPGEYTVAYIKTGFQSPARKRFSLTAALPVRLDASMAPLAKVAGRVLDAAGAPIAGVPVWIMGGREGWDATTDAQGRFEFDRVSAGSYRIVAQPSKSLKPPPSRAGERRAWVPTFFPGVTDAPSATRLTIRAGSELFDQDIRFQSAPVHRLRGVVVDAEGNPAAHVQVKLAPKLAILMRQADRDTIAVSGSDGAFEYADVVDGAWNLRAESSAEGSKLRAFEAETMAGHDLVGVQLRLSPPFLVRGSVVREGPPIKGQAAIMLAPEDGGDVSSAAAMGVDGRFEIAGIYPGRYTVHPISPGPPYYLASVLLGNRDVLNQTFDLMPGTFPLTIVYKADGGGVRGTVEECGSATVLFVPQDPALRIPEFTRTTQCGDHGHYEIANMRPGEYYGLAFDRGPGLEEMFFGFDLDRGLVNQAVPVTIRPNEFTSVDLRVTMR